jgi:hypothetical protein
VANAPGSAIVRIGPHRQIQQLPLGIQLDTSHGFTCDPVVTKKPAEFGGLVVNLERPVSGGGFVLRLGVQCPAFGAGLGALRLVF